MPSRSKIQYLLHLDDCRRLAIADLQHAKIVVQKAILTVASNDFCGQKAGDPDKARACEVFANFQEDIEFVVDKLEDLQMPISDVKAQIIEHVSLAQGQRTLILTIAAALFILLSFVAVSSRNFSAETSAVDHSQSIFGMNVQEPLFPPSNSRSSASPISAPSTTIDLSEPSQHYWTIPQYLWISLPLTAIVILLPMIGDPCWRLTIQLYAKVVDRSRATVAVSAPCFLVSGIVIFSTPFADGFSVMLYIILSYGVLSAICLIRLLTAYEDKKGRLICSIQLLTLSICIVLEFTINLQSPLVFVPWVYLFLTSKMVIRWFKRGWTWLTWKTRKQSVSQYQAVTTV
jgi:hypothetical protein